MTSPHSKAWSNEPRLVEKDRDPKHVMRLLEQRFIEKAQMAILAELKMFSKVKEMVEDLRSRPDFTPTPTMEEPEEYRTLSDEIRKAASFFVNQWSQQQDFLKKILMQHEEEKHPTLVHKTCVTISEQLKGWIDDAIPRKLKEYYETELFKPNPASPLTVKYDEPSTPTRRGFGGLDSSRGEGGWEETVLEVMDMCARSYPHLVPLGDVVVQLTNLLEQYTPPRWAPAAASSAGSSYNRKLQDSNHRKTVPGTEAMTHSVKVVLLVIFGDSAVSLSSDTASGSSAAASDEDKMAATVALLTTAVGVWEQLLKPLPVRKRRRGILEALFDCRAMCISLEATAAGCARRKQQLAAEGDLQSIGGGHGSSSSGGGGAGSGGGWSAGAVWNTLMLELLTKRLVHPATVERCWIATFQQAALSADATLLFARTTVEFVCTWQATIGNNGRGKNDADDSSNGGGNGSGDGGRYGGLSRSAPTTAHALHFMRLLVHVNRTPNLGNELRDTIQQCLRCGAGEGV